MRILAAEKFKNVCMQTLDELASSRRPIVITKRGKPVAKLVPVSPPVHTGTLAGSIVAESGDPYSTRDERDYRHVKTIWSLAAIIGMAAVGVSCSDVPSTNPTAPTGRVSTSSTQQSILAPVISIHIAPPVETMRIGETLSFSVNVQLGEGVPPSGPMPFWSSTHPAVILMDGSGNATAMGKGIATIEVVFKGLKTSRNIQVTS